jgi:peptidyl-prolyl cis-trans isomerase C
MNKNLIQTISSFFIGVVCTFLIISLVNKNKMMIDVSPQKQEIGELAAKINDEEIYVSEINKKLATVNPKLAFQNLKKEEKELLAKEVLVQRIILKSALSNNSHKKYSDKLKNIAIEEIKNNYLRDSARKNITEDQIEAKYKELINDVKGKKEYLVSHILTKTRTQIDKAFSALDVDTFEGVAGKFSTDTASARNGGNLGYILDGSTVKEFENEFKKLKKGKISKPFKTNLGWHIVQMNEKRDVKPAAYEEVKDRVESALIAQGTKTYVLGLVKDAKVEVF